MKIIKKIAAIMLSVMMVLGMCSVVGAVETSGTSEADKGKITIDNAIVGQTYTIYQILELESFSDKTTEPNTGNYAYKPTSAWKQFVSDAKNESGVKYFIKDGEYVKWNPAVGTDATVIAKFAKEALEYAGKNNINFTQQQTNVTNTLVEFEGLPLGYYLVDSSVGALCSLTTTDTDVTIQEKSGVPSVEKKIVVGSELKESNTASIGDTIKFQTTITAQPGAQNYVLHDKMDAGLTFNGIESVKVGENELSTPTDYAVEKSTGDDCTFHITFTPTYCESITATTTIIVTYSATLNENAEVGPTKENKNETWLKYGENKDLETIHRKTTTKTYEIPVFKYTKGASGTGAETGLKDAQFILRKQGESSGMGLERVTPTPTGKEGIVYCYKKNAAETIVTTDASGKFTIQGLAPGTYELVEKEAPKGYNKLSAPVKITIGSAGEVSYNTETNAIWVKVENKTGSILPSTGGMGTTLFYIFGAILVIGSGVVLITKKRMK